MREPGLPGGLSWLSTLDHYRYLNEGVNRRLGGLAFAERAICPVNFNGIHRYGWDDLGAHVVADQVHAYLGLPVVHISGMPGAAPLETAVPQVDERLAVVLEANGLTFADVLKGTVHATDLDAFIRVSDARKSCHGSWLPAANRIWVQRLCLPSFVVEVELVPHYRTCA